MILLPILGLLLTTLSNLQVSGAGPVVGKIIRNGTEACYGVLMSEQVLIAPSHCIYNSTTSRRLSYLRFLHEKNAISVTQVEVVDTSSYKSLAVALIQQAVSGISSFPAITWSFMSIEDFELNVAKPGSNPSGCKSVSASSSTLSFPVDRSPVVFTCPALAASEPTGSALYQTSSASLAGAVFALDMGTCFSKWGKTKTKGARCGVRIDKESFLNICKFAERYQQDILGCKDIILQKVEGNGMMKDQAAYDAIQAVHKSEGFVIIHCKSNCKVCSDFSDVFNMVMRSRELKDSKFIPVFQFWDASLTNPSVSKYPFIEFRRPYGTLKSHNGPLTYNDIINSIKGTGGTNGAPAPYCDPDGRMVLERKLIDLHKDMEQTLRPYRFHLADNTAVVKVIMDAGKVAGAGKDSYFQDMASRFMVSFDSPNINFVWEKSGRNEDFGFAFSSDFTTSQKRALSTWEADCSQAFLGGNTTVLPCSAPNNVKLCYPGTSSALYAVCYDTNGHVPTFTVHVLKPAVTAGSETAQTPTVTHDGQLATSKQAQDNVYLSALQQDLYVKWRDPLYDFLTKGYLVPNADFSGSPYDQRLTFHLTNAAPQWQAFNSGNWKVMERGLKKYANDSGVTLYVVTGTYNTSSAMKLTGHVAVPGSFWKAVCDPVAGESILFWADNPVGKIKSTDSLLTTTSCGQVQSDFRGVIGCKKVADHPSYSATWSIFPAQCNTANDNGMESLKKKLDLKFK